MQHSALGGKQKQLLILHEDFEVFVDNEGVVNRLRGEWQNEENPLPILSKLASHYIVLDRIEREGNKKSDLPCCSESSFAREFESCLKKPWGNFSLQRPYEENKENPDFMIIDFATDTMYFEQLHGSTSIDAFIDTHGINFVELEHSGLITEDYIGEKRDCTLDERTVNILSFIFFTTMFCNEMAAFNEDLVYYYRRIVSDYRSQSSIADKPQNNNFHLVIANNYRKYVSNLSIKTLIVSKIPGITSKTRKELRRLPEMSLAFMLESDQPIDVLDMAWMELFFACLSKMPICLCQFCGSIYRLDGANASGRYGRGTCGADCCKKMSRKQREERKWILDTARQRALVRERQRVHRLKKEFLQNTLMLKSSAIQDVGGFVEQFASSNNLDIDKVMSWALSVLDNEN